MASQVSPGVVIRERDFSNAVIVGATAFRGAIASSFRTGPVGKIVNIGSERELIDTFGTPSEANAGDWLVAAEFLRYGGQLGVVRAATGVLNATSTGGTATLIGTKEAFESGVGSGNRYNARYAGADGNNLRVVIVDRGGDYVITTGVAHGLSAGGTYTDDAAVGYEVISAPTTTTLVVLGSTAPTPAAGDSAVAYDYNTQPIAETGLTFKAIGPRPGTSAFAAERYLSNDEVHVAIVDESTNTIVERLTYLSKLSDAKKPEGESAYYLDYINEYSRYIYAGASSLDADETTATGEDPGSDAASYGATAAVPLDFARVLPTAGGALSGGADDYAYSAGEIQTAYDLFLDTEETEVDFILMGGNAANETDTISKAQAVAAIANSRKDCIAFISPWTGAQVANSGGAALTPANQLANTIEFFDNIASSSYVVLDSGVKYTYDRFSDKYRYVGCNGDVAGLCVSTSSTLDDWFSPAGLNRGGIQNVVKLAFNPNKAARDELYTNRINPIVSLSGTGPVLFGDKTALASPSAFDRINVRRLFLNVEKRAEGLAQGVLFDQNDSLTRGRFAASMNSYLSEIQARRGLTDFLVVCDESNNTPEVIDRNEFVAELYLKPTRSINFVTVTVTATRTGVSFAEVIGR
jgi:hypothetical protein